MAGERMKFKFKLESVLNYRMDIEKEQYANYLKEDQHLTLLQERMNELNKEMTEIDVRLKEKGISSSYYCSCVQYKEFLKQKETEFLKKIYEQSQITLQKKDEWVEARKEVLILEKLKEKQAAEFKQKMEDLEQKELDELATLRFNR